MRSTKPSALQLRIGLQQVEPEIWRRVLVPGNATLGSLHRMCQAAMGWTDTHLHQFRAGGEVYGSRALDDFDVPEDMLDENAVTVAEVAGGLQAFFYDYDFGDGWEHEVRVEEVVEWPWALKHAVCVAGERACPPEDVGGPFMYPELLAAIADPGHEKHQHWTDWADGGFDPEWFSLVAANTALQYL